MYSVTASFTSAIRFLVINSCYRKLSFDDAKDNIRPAAFTCYHKACHTGLLSAPCRPYPEFPHRPGRKSGLPALPYPLPQPLLLSYLRMLTLPRCLLRSCLHRSAPHQHFPPENRLRLSENPTLPYSHPPERSLLHPLSAPSLLWRPPPSVLFPVRPYP